MSTYATSAKPGERATASGSGSRLPDPVGELRFMVTVDDDTRIGAFSECSGLSAEYEILEYQEGGENRFVHRLRGRVKYPNLVLKRGVTHEEHFLQWFLAAKDRGERGAVTVTLVGDDGKADPELVVRGGVPGQVARAVAQRQVDQRRHRDGRDRPSRARGGGVMAAAPLTGFKRASLSIEGQGEPIECWFNPKDYSIRNEPVEDRAGRRRGAPKAQFGGGEPRKLTLDLLFDSSDTDADVSGVTSRCSR